MATDSIQVSAVIPASPEVIYAAWLDSESHARMTGGPASIDAIVGGKHSAWDGYISGEIVALEPGRRIVKTWRTSEFPDGAGHSRVEITLVEEESGTRVALDHSDIPEGQGQKYLEGWDEFYFKPMLAFFGAPAEEKAEKKPAAKRASKKTAKKAAKKGAAKKTAKKAAKKGAAKKTAKKAAKKGAAKKTAKKAAKKGAAKKTAKKAAKKGAAKKTAKKAAKKGAAKRGAKARKAAPAPEAPPAAGA